jgi:serine/threonine protein kinase/Tfp pilus assembly protein PilF
MVKQPIEEKEVFNRARHIATPEERLAYLQTACGHDPAALRRIHELLRVYEQERSFLESSPVAPSAGLDASHNERPDTVIGAYRLLEHIGEGGFGVVYMAEQQQPVRRKVALKVLKPGMDTRQVIARFEAERQALALMDHPNIARIFDGGETDGGRPYFVMELVRGVPITDFCDQNQLPPQDRLKLFLTVCQAVQHAHLKGIIHRDLKPSNVLVTLHDGTAVVKVIDFGIAKATGRQLTAKTLFTNYAQMIGTPMYMSPEQAEMSGLDIDTRTDIYALGVLLYELLTGTTPFDRERLRTVAYDEMRRIIREEEPPRPSTRLSTLGQATATVSANRKSDLRRLQQLFRGELDWIVMKALEKDRNRRYETASALAADVQRFLNDEPVQACPPSRWYRFRKLVRRNKPAFLAASALALGLLVVIITLAASNLWIRQEQERTREEKDHTEKARQLAEQRANEIREEQNRTEKARQLAEQRAAEIRDGLERLQRANDLLDRSRFYIFEQRWDDAVVSLARAVQLRPDYASAWVELSNFYTRLGLWEQAAEAFAKELQVREPDTTDRWFQHAVTRVYLKDTEGYRRVARRMRERYRGSVNVSFSLPLIRAQVALPDPDIDPQEWAERAERLVPNHRRDRFVLYLAGIAHYRAGHHEQAAGRLQASLEAGPQWPVHTLSNPILAMAHHRLGHPAEARQALNAAARAIDQWTEEMYQQQGDRGWVRHFGAAGYWPISWWDWLEFQIYYREAKLLIDGALPPADPRQHVLRARAFAGLRSHGRAQAEYDAALKLRPHDPQIRWEAHRNRGYGLLSWRLWKQVAAEFAQAWELQPQDIYLGLFTAVTQLAAGDQEAYRQTCALLVERCEKTEDVWLANNVLTACVLRPDALPDMARLLPLARVAAQPSEIGSVELGAVLFRLGKYEEAVRCLEALDKNEPLRPAGRCFLAMAHERLGHAKAARAALAEAGRWVDQAGREQRDISGMRPAWETWHEPLECAALLKEARLLLGQKAP